MCTQILSLLFFPYVVMLSNLFTVKIICFSLQSKENMGTIDCITEKENFCPTENAISKDKDKRKTGRKYF